MALFFTINVFGFTKHRAVLDKDYTEQHGESYCPEIEQHKIFNLPDFP